MWNIVGYNLVRIKRLKYTDLEKVWKESLWVGRQDIESRSAMQINSGYDMRNMEGKLWCYGAVIGIHYEIIAVNSMHLCGDNSMRSRGLWVNPNFRRQGYGAAMLEYAIAAARREGCPYIWSYPRKTSWSTYESVGFKLTSEWGASDTSPENAFCKLDLN